MRFKIYLSLLVFSIFQLNEIESQNQVTNTITHDGMARSYITYIPESYSGNESVPVVFNFHGYTSNAGDQMNYGDFRPIADRESFLVVCPQGTIDGAGNTYWNAQWNPSGVDDIGFVSALIDSLAKDYNVNLNRVYSTGMSNGGFMSYTLACELSDKIAAIASVTGTMTTTQISLQCRPDNLTPIMEIHGTADGVVPFDGNNDWMAPIDDVMSFWVARNNCDPVEVTMLPDINSDDASTVEKHFYAGCDENSTIELMKVLNGGHTWPGAFPIGRTNQDISASEEIWRFFAQYDLNGNLSSVANKNQLEDFKLFPTHSESELNLEFKAPAERKVTIFSVDGKVVFSNLIFDVKNQLSISNLHEGIYFLQVDESSQVRTKRFIKI